MIDVDTPHPLIVGFAKPRSTLCIGLDMAWYGGSKGRPASQFDCLVSTTTGAEPMDLKLRALKLEGRDPEASQLFEAIQQVVLDAGQHSPVVLAIDAPLQGVRDVRPGGKKVRRHCEDLLSRHRVAIDRSLGGARGWHPQIQPGMPLADRVRNLLVRLESELDLRPWTPDTAENDRLVIECFPAQAIWAAKRQGSYVGFVHGSVVKDYKNQGGKLLTAEEVRGFVEKVLVGAFDQASGLGKIWPRLVELLSEQMLARKDWLEDGRYPGGKKLDDPIDSMVCLATATAYATGSAHLWHCPANTNDGHIIGPGAPGEWSSLSNLNPD